jgi:hypothetical protein
MRVGGQRHVSAALPLGERDPVTILQEAGWTPGPVWTGAENLPPPHPTGIRSPDRAARRASLYRLSYPSPNYGGNDDDDDDDMLYLIPAIGVTSGGSSTVHNYTQTIHRTIQLTQTIHGTTQLTQTINRTTQLAQTIHRTQFTNWEQCGPYSGFASYTLAFALQLKKKHGKTSVRVDDDDDDNNNNLHYDNIIIITKTLRNM